MKDFDINKIGKKMPYEAPDEKFFEEFTDDLLAKVAPQPKRQFWLGRKLTPVWGIAAAVAVVLSVTLNLGGDKSAWGNDYIISENLDESIDSFFDNLSDDELAYLLAENSYNDDFFSNLPID
ncbi:MAG: hypothetical protein R3Y44_05665 [Rikenellaceae bacterium]